MDQKMEKQLLLDLYHSYVQLASERELVIHELPPQQLANISVVDLRATVHRLEALVRTPK